MKDSLNTSKLLNIPENPVRLLDDHRGKTTFKVEKEKINVSLASIFM